MPLVLSISTVVDGNVMITLQHRTLHQTSLGSVLSLDCTCIIINVSDVVIVLAKVIVATNAFADASIAATAVFVTAIVHMLCACCYCCYCLLLLLLLSLMMLLTDQTANKVKMQLCWFHTSIVWSQGVLF